MEVYTEVAVEAQAVHSSEKSDDVSSARRVGIEIVSSATLSSRFFHGPKRICRRPLVASNSDDDWARRVSRAMAQ